MPALTKRTEALRISQAAKALALMAQGKTQKEACELAGISPDKMRRWLATEAEAISAIRDMTIELERANLAAVIVARSRIAHKIAEIVETTPLPIKDLIAADQHLRQLQSDLEGKYGTQAQDAEAEQFLNLSGPSLNKPKSVFSARVTRTETTLEVNARPEDEEDEEIIDAEFEED